MSVHRIALLLAGLINIGHGRRVQLVETKASTRDSLVNHVKDFAILLLALKNPRAGWQLVAHSHNNALKSAAGKAPEPREVLDGLFRRYASAACPRGQVSMQFVQAKWNKERVPASFEGTDLTVTSYPCQVLRAPNKPITEFDDNLKKICAGMFKVMYGCEGVGVAAPQVGLNLQVFVWNPDPLQNDALKPLREKICCNPKIVEYSAATDIEEEGCLSSAGACCSAMVRRAKEIKVEYQDVRGNLQRDELEGWMARIFQHEYDHLQGVLHFDRTSPELKEPIQPYLDVLIEEHGPGGAIDLTPEVRTSLKPLPLDMKEDIASRDGRREEAKQAAKKKAKAAAAAAKKPGGFSMGGGAGGAGGAGKKAKSKKKKR